MDSNSFKKNIEMGTKRYGLEVKYICVCVCVCVIYVCMCVCVCTLYFRKTDIILLSNNLTNSRSDVLKF